MVKPKKDYFALVYLKDQIFPKNLYYIEELNNFTLNIDKEFPNWKYIDVYNYKTSLLLKRITPENNLAQFIE